MGIASALGQHRQVLVVEWLVAWGFVGAVASASCDRLGESVRDDLDCGAREELLEALHLAVVEELDAIVGIREGPKHVDKSVSGCCSMSAIDCRLRPYVACGNVVDIVRTMAGSDWVEVLSQALVVRRGRLSHPPYGFAMFSLELPDGGMGPDEDAHYLDVKICLNGAISFTASVQLQPLAE
ncbi:hypothetical protein BV22DRAFT_1049523 [Leucogyrophana mollusca]|uniref:Uncharacterized protein n=1 Tax=Leucogyrophana mollusca TaxID=85980 RepID=A0ACB8B809_9AGAM|nr:hypothetical protein BV22DRAFT_1049523 [Leucogyrophana mollusca]